MNSPRASRGIELGSVRLGMVRVAARNIPSRLSWKGGLSCPNPSRAPSISTSVTRLPIGSRTSNQKAPEGSPNVLYIVLDDVGFSAMGCYGGAIETPNID